MRSLRALARHLPLHLCVVLLLACVVARPVISSLGEVHELAHPNAATHDHPPHHGAESEADNAPDTGPVDPLDALLHFAHCCGHVPALQQDSRPLLVSHRLAAAPRPLDATAIKPTPAPGLFRPPIA